MNSAEVISGSQNSNQLSEPLWPPLVAMLAVAGLYASLPKYLLGRLPRGSLALIVIGLLVAIIITHRGGRHALHQVLG